MKKKLFAILMFILVTQLSAQTQTSQSRVPAREFFMGTLNTLSSFNTPAPNLTGANAVAFVDPLAEVIYFFDLVRGLIGDALGYWQNLKGVAGIVSHPLSLLKTLARDWLQSCTPQVPLPNFMDTFMDFVSGKTPYICCDKSILDYFLNDLSGGQIHWLDKNGQPMISPNNNFYALDRYEAAKALTSLGPDRSQLSAALDKAEEIQNRVLDNSNAAKTTLDGLTGILKVEGIRADMNGSDVMFSALERMKKLRGQTFVDMSTSAAIEGVFGAGPLLGSPNSSSPAGGAPNSGYQNLFQ
jgi:hypothetical protein